MIRLLSKMQAEFLCYDFTCTSNDKCSAGLFGTGRPRGAFLALRKYLWMRVHYIQEDQLLLLCNPAPFTPFESGETPLGEVTPSISKISCEKA